MTKVLWLLTAVASVIAGLVMFVGISKANGAPQEAAVSAMALGIAIIPYVFTRAWEGMASDK
ncbi:hypothetical protein ABNQ39_20865 [Azospirillum sp. A26]|uniref:hypothetical protein n=1 Tax=unclassified Azospirillum TaxID=2630922 RepID=UPI000D61E50E|nr:hypothetical protein [Azospirillum sp. TSA6c]PWC54251.1 hypothetical protein TSA6c_00570 [Azospirillum sp. TSA6c]